MLTSTSDSRLLDLPDSLHLVRAYPRDDDPTRLVLWIDSRSASAGCPQCHTLSAQPHTRWWRTLADLPVAGQAVKVRLQLWRYRCRCSECPRRTFTERLPDFIRDYARRTDRMKAALTAVGFAEGGRAGAREAHVLGLYVSRQTLLRLVRATPPPTCPTPRALGVDDWAIRPGVHYGTVLVSMIR